MDPWAGVERCEPQRPLIRVLLVDDHAMVREGLRFLEDLKYAV